VPEATVEESGGTEAVPVGVGEADAVALLNPDMSTS
jgi:hypothetical protein